MGRRNLEALVARLEVLACSSCQEHMEPGIKRSLSDSEMAPPSKRLAGADGAAAEGPPSAS